MKRIVFFLVIILGIVSCDKIEKPYKIEPEVIITVDTPSFPPLADVYQKYLFEDYTGHKCPNCPEGADILKKLHAEMMDTLILMTIHAGSTARPISGGDCPYTADYRTPAGNDYNETFQISSYPSGMINRKNFGGSPVLDNRANWISIMRSVPRNEPTIALQIIPIISNDTAYIFIKSTLLSNVSSKLRLCAVLVENGIVSPQLNGKSNLGHPNICDYVHNHVLRTSITSTWGDNIDLPDQNDAIIKTYGLLFAGQPWKKENCHIIAYIYDDDTKEVLQVEEVELLEK